MVSVLTSSQDGMLVRAEKSKTCEWLKLPAPSTSHVHPNLLGTGERPVEEEGGLGVKSTVADGDGADLDEPHVPKAGWQPFSQ